MATRYPFQKTVDQRQGRRDIIIALDPVMAVKILAPWVRMIREKAVVLAIAKKAQAAANRRAGYRAVLIRDGDYYIRLSKRREKARAAQADFYFHSCRCLYRQAGEWCLGLYLSDRGASSGIASI